ncbi:MAG: hypothetical protein WBO04_07870 [Steroidobacteraceae bacterium]
MRHDFWHERWRTGQVGFHQPTVHPLLERWWPALGVPPDARVYVPLCGKSLDMTWLAERGHRVVGNFVRHTAGPYELLEGDALALTPEILGPVDAVYDRAALVALPPAMRAGYAESMTRLMPSGVAMLLIAFEYPQEMKGGPPFSVEESEIRAKFGPAFDVDILERVDILAQEPKFAEFGIPALHEIACRLIRR